MTTSPTQLRAALVLTAQICAQAMLVFQGRHSHGLSVALSQEHSTLGLPAGVTGSEVRSCLHSLLPSWGQPLVAFPTPGAEVGTMSAHQRGSPDLDSEKGRYWGINPFPPSWCSRRIY